MATSLPILSSTPLEKEKVVIGLIDAIQTGNGESAKNLIALLSNLHLKLAISISKEQDGQRHKEKGFMLTVQLEDRLTTGLKRDLLVRVSDTIEDLKRRAWLRWDFPIATQRWIIGKKIPDDKMTLKMCGVCGPGYTVFLYNVTARSVGLEENNTEKGRDEFESDTPMPIVLQTMSNVMLFDGKGTGFNTLLMNANDMGAASIAQIDNPQAMIKPQGQCQSMPPPIPARVPFEDEYDPDQTQVVHVKPSKKFPLSSLKKEASKPPEPRWVCQSCTFHNLPTRPGCEICTKARPEGYVVPDGYQMTDEEVALQAHQEELERLTRQSHEMALNENFKQWLLLDDQDLIPNTEAFMCPICFTDLEPGDGIMLRECLHEFCRDCLEGAITHSEEPTLRCPYKDDNETCHCDLQEREVRALVADDVFIKYLQRGLDQAESQAANSFHCKTTDCKGWCLYEDEVNFFTCPICQKENCLTCKEIHEGMNCKEYQADLAVKAANDDAARQTQKVIQEMVTKGKAMHCPQCQIILQKKDGCDWIKCSVCKTEICWVTKGRRWGPGGNGDTSGGCRCGVNGRCHPNCGNCH